MDRLFAFALGLLWLAALPGLRTAQGQVINGGFENDGAGWTLSSTSTNGYGSAAVTFPVSVTAPEGSKYAELASTAVSGAGEDFSHMDVINSDSISQTINAKAGDCVSFDYLLNQYVEDPMSNAYASVTVSCGDYSVTANYSQGGYIPGQPLANGWSTYSFPPFTNSAYQFTVTDSAYAESEPEFPAGLVPMTSSSTVDFDAVVLSPVPEPSTIAILAAGIIALLGYEWRRRRQIV